MSLGMRIDKSFNLIANCYIKEILIKHTESKNVAVITNELFDAFLLNWNRIVFKFLVSRTFIHIITVLYSIKVNSKHHINLVIYDIGASDIPTILRKFSIMTLDDKNKILYFSN